MGRNIGPPYAMLGPNWIYLGPKLPQMGSTILAFGPDYTQQQSIWVSIWIHLGPIWANLCIFGLIWVPCLTQFGPMVGPMVGPKHISELQIPFMLDTCWLPALDALSDCPSSCPHVDQIIHCTNTFVICCRVKFTCLNIDRWQPTVVAVMRSFTLSIVRSCIDVFRCVGVLLLLDALGTSKLRMPKFGNSKLYMSAHFEF
jgi:hypothetical protein